MDLFAELKSLLTQQDVSGLDPAEVLAKIGSPSASIAILDQDFITPLCISTVGDDEQTLFQACSISKPIAGMATMKLVDQGRLRLDDKISELLPPSLLQILETPSTKRLVSQITVKQLMSHTSGLSVHGFPGYVDKGPDARTVLSGTAPSNTCSVRLHTLPGQEYSYSGGGITVLQVILETLTGQDFPSLVRELVFEPLGMARSFYHLPAGESNISHAHYTGYTPCETPWRNNPEQAAAGLWTTPTDLLKAVRAMQRSLNSEPEAFLPQHLAQEMLTEVSSAGMGLTWYAPAEFSNVFGHSGNNLPGWNCYLGGYAATNGSEQKVPAVCGLCVMTNSAAGDQVVSKLVHALSFLKKWPRIRLHAYSAGCTPLVAGADRIAADWSGWKGIWETQWCIEEDAACNPTVRYCGMGPIRLLPAAIPSSGDRSIDLVLEGLEVMLSLTWEHRLRVVELWSGASGKTEILRK